MKHIFCYVLKDLSPFITNHYCVVILQDGNLKRKCKDCSSIFFSIMYYILHKCKQKIDVKNTQILGRDNYSKFAKN